VQLQGLLGGLRLLGPGGAQAVPALRPGGVLPEQNNPEGAGGQDTPPGEAVEEQSLSGHVLQPALRVGDGRDVHQSPPAELPGGGGACGIGHSSSASYTWGESPTLLMPAG